MIARARPVPRAAGARQKRPNRRSSLGEQTRRAEQHTLRRPRADVQRGVEGVGVVDLGVGAPLLVDEHVDAQLVQLVHLQRGEVPEGTRGDPHP